MNDPTITAKRSEMALAFEQWEEAATRKPENWCIPRDENFGEAAADIFISLLEKSNDRASSIH